MAFKIDATLIKNIDQPPLNMLNYFINLKNSRRFHYDKLERYYLGKHIIFDREFSNLGSKNNKVMTNYAKYIVDMVTGMITGNPITYIADDGNDISSINDSFNKMDIAAHDTELERDLSCFGKAYEMAYLSAISDTQTVEKIALLDVRDTFVITDDTEDANVLYGVYMIKKLNLDGSDNGYLISVYTPNVLIQYRTINGTLLADGNIQSGYPKVTKHYWGAEPITEYKNNEQEQGDFEQLISQIDAYNSLQSDRIADKDAFVDAILLAYGTQIDGILKKGQMLDGLPPKSEGTSIEWLTKTLDEAQAQTLADSISADIHEMSNVPDMNDQNFAGNVSGEAMKYKLFGLLNLISVKSQSLKKGLRRRLELMGNMLHIKAQNVDSSDIRIQITPNIPVNMVDTINNIKNADGIIPRLVTYGWLPEGYDPNKLMEMMQQQNDDQIASQQKAFSEPATGNLDNSQQEDFRNDSNTSQSNTENDNN